MVVTYMGCVSGRRLAMGDKLLHVELAEKYACRPTKLTTNVEEAVKEAVRRAAAEVPKWCNCSSCNEIRQNILALIGEGGEG